MIASTARMRDNRHYLSDVVFGTAMGIAGERTVMRSGRYTARVLPSFGPKFASLTIVVTRHSNERSSSISPQPN